MLFPALISKLIDKYIISLSLVAKNCIEGVLKISIFLGYTKLTSLMKDIATTYRYHGAEHKSIACYESGEELTVEKVKKHMPLPPEVRNKLYFPCAVYKHLRVYGVGGVVG